MINRTTTAISILAALLLSFGCKSASGSDSAQATAADSTPKAKVLGSFNADSAYSYVAGQVSFGPRVPGSEGHRACRDYIIGKLEQAGVDTLIVQDATVTAFNGDRLPISNIIAGFNPTQSRRVLLVAHWDTRPWADTETSAERREQPILGANDGGSGTAVLLEIARNLAMRKPSVGVDLLFVDAEDYGNGEGFGRQDDTWCLGSQYWVEHMVPYTPDNLPIYGILLDMVGGRGARFHYEDFSARKAQTPTVKVWSEAEAIGYGDLFPRTVGGAAIDDHVVLTRAGIPTTDIIEINNEVTGSFPPTWHTHSDDLKSIDRNTLKAVGETVLNVIYKEKPF
ncbi:MAG: M28 family peptidase [Muribaculaceae bacterium]|nr:M28 family peptidase [Muribaculaceae bacterium]